MRKLIMAAALVLIGVSSAHAATTEIAQADQQFSTDSVTLKAGDEIHFTNKDTVTHNVKILSDDDTVDKGLQKPGEVIVAKFDKPGTYQVRCGIHPKMKVAVKVE